MKNKFLTFATVGLLLFSHFIYFPLFSWWDQGHMIVAKIAYDEMSDLAKEKTNLYLLSVSQDFPNHADMETAALWADDISQGGIDAFREWHGSARPFDPQNILTEQEILKLETRFDNNDIVFAINKCIKTIKDPNATLWCKGFMLRMLIHIVGDIHQPCHCVTLFDARFPKGDTAGTKFLISHDKFLTLHQLFDSVFGLADSRPERPVTEMDRKLVADLSKTIKEQNPRDSFPQLHEKRIDAWREESYEIGKNFVYNEIEFGQKPSDSYMEKGRKITTKQLALAGYRLSDLLEWAYSP